MATCKAFYHDFNIENIFTFIVILYTYFYPTNHNPRKKFKRVLIQAIYEIQKSYTSFSERDISSVKNSLKLAVMAMKIGKSSYLPTSI